MRRTRFSLRPTEAPTGTPFFNAEQAWLWAAYAVRYDEPGAHLTANKAAVRRPCEPRDVIFLACRLRREGRMSGLEFGTLCRFGAKDRPPDARDPDEARDFGFWERAIAKLEPELARKGIVSQYPESEAKHLKQHSKRTKHE